MANHISPDDVYRQLIGKKIDIDNFPAEQPYQCYDPFAWYCRKVWDFTPYCRPSGYVRDFVENFVGTGLNKYFTLVPLSQIKDGDWVVWGIAPATPVSHIGMFRKWQGSSIIVLQQNAPYPYMTQNLITKNGIIGILRPKVTKPKGETKLVLEEQPPVFKTSYYLDQNPDVKKAYTSKSAVQHWKKFGIKEGRASAPNFHVKEYLENYPDLRKAFGAKGYARAVRHYYDTGINEGRSGRKLNPIKKILTVLKPGTYEVK